MATYYHGASEIQADGLQTLYLMNPGYVGYSDPQTPANMVFLNSAGNPLNPANLPHTQQQNQHLVGIPLQAPPVAPHASQESGRPSLHSPQQEISGVQGFFPRVHYNIWASSVDAAAAAAAAGHHQIPSSVGVTSADINSHLGLRRPAQASAQQGLSLSLSPQQPAYAGYRTDSDMTGPVQAPAISPASGDDVRISGGSSSSAASAVSNGISGLQSVLMGSKYLKAAQQLLDEVVNVGKGIKSEASAKGNKGQMKGSKDGKTASGTEASSGAGETSMKRSASELTTAERQELQMKKAKLVGMLDEVCFDPSLREHELDRLIKPSPSIHLRVPRRVKISDDRNRKRYRFYQLLGGDGRGEERSEQETGGPYHDDYLNENGAVQLIRSYMLAMMNALQPTAMIIATVEQRYRQYHHQMQIVISSFEAAAGFGSAKTYTALALQTISKQFRCLRDAISGQIRATSKNLGEEECLGGKSEGSRLRLVDHHLRQQRALQQLGMIQHNAWRPQRGLPERSVSVLRAWLFEHFLHPYPKDSDKHMLAKQTGLTRNQVSNWFINARVRLWKPMVEEMYLEETKDADHNGSDVKTSKSEMNEERGSKSGDPSQQQHNSPATSEHVNHMKSKPEGGVGDPSASLAAISNCGNPASSNAAMGGARAQACFPLIGSPDTQASFHDKEVELQGSRKKARTHVELPCSDSMTSMSAETDMKSDDTNNRELYLKFGGERQGRDGYPIMTGPAGNGGGGSGFGAFQMGETGRFDPEQFAPRFSGSNGFSLTLGLPHCENLSLSATQQPYLSNQNLPMGRRIEMGSEASDFCSMNGPSAAHSSNAYESINIQSRKRFVAQLLPDFVA
ncbi:hypothetical protein ACLOJK_006049 [Asimina triloba]